MTFFAVIACLKWFHENGMRRRFCADRFDPFEFLPRASTASPIGEDIGCYPSIVKAKASVHSECWQQQSLQHFHFCCCRFVQPFEGERKEEKSEGHSR